MSDKRAALRSSDWRLLVIGGIVIVVLWFATQDPANPITSGANAGLDQVLKIGADFANGTPLPGR